MFGIGNEIKLLIEDKWLLCQCGFAVYMIILAAMDIRWKKVHFLFLLSGALFIPAGIVCGRNMPEILLAAGSMVGVLFLLLSKVTRESFGYGDSILILITGGFIGFWNILVILVAAFFFAAGFSMFMMIRRKFHRKSAFPFIPFLTAAYIGGMAFGIY